MVVFLFLLVLAALAGVLGTVLKITVFIVGAIVLGLVVATVAAGWVLRNRLGKIGQRLQPGSTQIDIGSPRRTGGGGSGSENPGPRDDRY